MQRTIGNSSLTGQRFLGLGLLFNYSVSILFTLLVSFGQLSAYASSTTSNLVTGNHIPIIEKEVSYSYGSLPFDIPAGSTNENYKVEVTDDSDTDEDDGDTFHATLNSLQYSICSEASAYQFLAFSSAQRTHSSVPFFILYHSWKSFLS